MKRILAQLRKTEQDNFIIKSDLETEKEAVKHSNTECERLRQALVEANSDIDE